MPEGDTLLKLARAMAPELEGREVARAEVERVAAPWLAGRRVGRVRAVGKHLLIELAAGEGGGPSTLRSHLGLHGSWHRYAPGEAWLRPAWQASLVLETAADVFVCFNARQVQVMDGARPERQRELARLGPDLLAEDGNGEATLEEIVARARRLCPPESPILDVLLDQTVACGIGNIYKNEVLFLERVHPARGLGTLGDGEVRRLYATARRLMAANLGGWFRTTTVDRRAAPAPRSVPRMWVYGRAGRPCLRCRAPIRHRAMGRDLRVTYWCPRCQPSP